MNILLHDPIVASLHVYLLGKHVNQSREASKWAIRKRAQSARHRNNNNMAASELLLTNHSGLLSVTNITQDSD